MALQLVGRKIYKHSAFPSGDQSVSLTDLAGGLASQPAQGDLIVIAFGTADSADRTLTIKDAGGTAYTLIGSEVYLNDLYDTNFRAAYKVAGGSPDTSVTIASDRGSTGFGAVALISVWRGADPSTQMDVSATGNSNIDTGAVNPAAITPITTGAVILAMGVGTTNTVSSPSAFTSSDLTDFQTDAAASSTANMMGGMGYYAWTSGSFDPATWPSASSTTSDTWASITIAIRPLLTSSGTASITLGSVALSATGAIQAKGTASITLAAATLSAAGGVQAKGVSSSTLAAVTVSATGTVSGGNVLNITLGALTLAGVGAVQAKGTITVTLSGLTRAATGTVLVKGTSSKTLTGLTFSATGAALAKGSAALTLSGVTTAATGIVFTPHFDVNGGISPARYNSILVEIEPLDPVSGLRKTVRVTNVNDSRVTGMNSLIWRPAISENARLGIRMFKGDFDGVASPAGGSLAIQVDQVLPQQSGARRFVWVGAPLRIWAGRAGDAWPWDQVFEGLVGDNPRAERNRVTLPIEVNTEPFKADILTAKYAGTGLAEGGSDLKDKPKPFLLGRCFNAQPVLINTTDSVYQFSAYGPIQAVTKLYERGSDFGASFGDYANYAALVAAAIPPGRWGTCLAEGLVRLGAPQVGVITGDVDGDKYGGTWRRKTGEIILRVATNAGASALVNTTSLSDLDTAVAAVATNNQGRIGVFITEQENLLEFASRLAAPCNAQAGISLLGELFVSRPTIGTAVKTLDAQQRQMPVVTKSVELGTRPPFYRIEMGYARSWKAHTSDEIAYYADRIERGRYDAVEFYREGNIVDVEDGSRWVYINAVPASGNAPPTWPTTSNAYWSILTPPSIVSAQLRIKNGRVATNARDTSNVARKLLIATDVGANVTISVARHDWVYPDTSGTVMRELGTITGLSFGTTYYVYFDDVTLIDDTVTYAATTSFDTAQNTNTNPGRHYLGPIKTPLDGGSPTDSDGVIGTGMGAGPNIYAGLLYLNGTVALTVDNINTDNDVNGLTPDAPTGVSISSVLLPDSTARITVVWSFTPSATPSNKNSIDGFLVGLKSQAIGTGGYTYSHADRNSSFRWEIVRPDQLAQTFEVPVDREYTAVAIPFRKVMTSINVLGEVLGSVGQSSSSTPHNPGSSPLFTGLIGSGTSANNIEIYASYANAGLNSGGTVKASKVDTAAIVANALNQADWEAQGGTLSLSGSSGFEWRYFSVVHANSAYPFVLQFLMDYQMVITNPDLGDEITATVQLVAKRTLGGSTTYYSDDGSLDPFTLSEVWQGASQTGPYLFSRKTALFEHVFEGLPADTYEIGYRVACPSCAIDLKPYRYLRAEDRKALS